ncbi:lipase 3-like [Plodia interpunctella]|uniref:lipase 3-like n=1 Tax=Plodia interpunctella TaxID=58824 RepID=UPI002368ECED|nr:lipase 3-like [Plodia interpunctella]
MNVHILFLLTITAANSQNQTWTFPDISEFFKNQTDRVNAFFDEQKLKLETAVNTSYVEAISLKDNVDNYVEEQKKIVNDEVNNYVKEIKQQGRKVADTWSFVPNEVVDRYRINDGASEFTDAVLTVPAIVSRNGYNCETHTIISEGYVLNIHRIPRSKNSGVISRKTILLQHGVFASSADWIFNGPGKGLAYVLADAGYDVWMSNIRGNRYSKEHLWWKSDSKEYWNFSWHDVAMHDVPAVIDYILKVKGSDTKITYIGHSMGTTILFTMLTVRPEYNDILNSAIALAPVVYMSDIKSPLKSFAPIASNVAYMQMLYGSHEFIPKVSTLGEITKTCEAEHMDTMVCNNIVFYICGYDEAQFNKTLLPIFLAHLGTGTSWKTVVHFAQEIVSGGRYQYFDYGSYYNVEVYGTETPPEYDLSKVTLPITLFWAKNDLLSSEGDVRALLEKLPDTTKSYLVPHPEFNHLDYLWAIDAPRLINDKVLSTLNESFENIPKFFNFRIGF